MTGVRVRQCRPDGYSIYGEITTNDGIVFKAILRYGSGWKQRHKYCLEICSGRRKGEETIIAGWDYFGNSYWNVSFFRLDPERNRVNMYVVMGLRNTEDMYSERIHDVVLQQNKRYVTEEIRRTSITDDFCDIKRDTVNNSVIFISKLYAAAYDDIEALSDDNDTIVPPIVKTKKCVSCTKKQPLSLFNTMDDKQRQRSCRTCMSNMNTKRVTRFPSRIIAMKKFK